MTGEREDTLKVVVLHRHDGVSEVSSLVFLLGVGSKLPLPLYADVRHYDDSSHSDDA